MNASALPTSWEVVTLGEVLQLNYGKGLPKAKREKGIFPVYGSNGVVGSHSDFIVEQPCLIVGRKGSIGEVNLSNEPSWPIDTTYFIDLFHGQPIKYWFFQLRVLPLTEMNRASAIPGLNREDAYQQKIGLPPLNEQRRIVAKIEELTAHSKRARAALDEVPTLIKQFKQSVLAAAFRGDLTADWREKNPDVEPAEKLLERIRDELTEVKQKKIKNRLDDPHPIPNPWRWQELSSISFVVTDGDHQAPPKTDSGIPFIVISNINTGSIDFSDTRFVSKEYYERLQSHRKPKRGDIIYSVVGTYGIPVLVDTDKEFCFQRHIALLRCSNQIDRQYLVYALQSKAVFDQATKVSTGTTQLTVTLTGLRKMKVPICSLPEQREIVRLVRLALKHIAEVITTASTNLEQLDKLDQSILAKAFRGELVSQDPNDEPAAVLLERIRAEREKLEAAKKKKKRRTKNGPILSGNPEKPQQR